MQEVHGKHSEKGSLQDQEHLLEGDFTLDGRGLMEQGEREGLPEESAQKGEQSGRRRERECATDERGQGPQRPYHEGI